jgi:nucleotide-binding universal stress UspA family protein
VFGNPVVDSVREVVRGRYDLLVKPAETEGSRSRVAFGSTDLQLLRLSPCAVWITKPMRSARKPNVLVALDLVPSDREKTVLANRVLQSGKDLAGLLQAKLHALHVWSLYGEARLRRPTFAFSVPELLREEEQRRRRWLAEAMKANGLTAGDVRIHLRKGDAKRVIPAVARNQRIDLLVMGTVGRTGVPGLLIGNTADAVLYEVACAVLAIKPKGFVTPVAARAGSRRRA